MKFADTIKLSEEKLAECRAIAQGNNIRTYEDLVLEAKVEKLKSMKKAEKKFRFSGKHAILTYKTHIKREKCTFIKNLDTCKIFHEIGKTGYKHTHIVVCFNKKVNTRKINYFDVIGEDGENIHPNIKSIKTKQHWENCVNYDGADKKKDIEKLETEFDNLTGNEYMWLGNVRNIIQAHKKWADVVNDDDLMTYLQRYLNWCKEVWACRPKYNDTKDLNLRKWQQALVDSLKAQNNRQIMWIYDKHGGNGKSVLSNYLIDNHGAFLCNNGALRDISCAFDGEETVIFDLPRTTIAEDGKDYVPYRIMEMFKDGRMFSSKYNSCLKRFKSCKVVVMANFLPDTTKLSADRWDIRTLDNGVLSLWRPLAPGVLNIKEDSCHDVDDEKIDECEEEIVEIKKVKNSKKSNKKRGKRKNNVKPLTIKQLRERAKRKQQAEDIFSDDDEEI